MAALALMPDRPAFNDALTSSAFVPMLETIPRPVTTTRLI
jgi:hypothetical protein